MAKARGEGAPPCSFESRILMVACRRGFFRAAEVGLFGCYCRRLAARCAESWGARRRTRETPAEKRLEEVVEGGEGAPQRGIISHMARCGVIVCLLLKSGNNEARKLWKFKRGPGTTNGRGRGRGIHCAVGFLQLPAKPAAPCWTVQCRTGLLVLNGPLQTLPVIVAQCTPTLVSPPTCNDNGRQPSLNLETRSQPHSIATSYPRIVVHPFNPSARGSVRTNSFPSVPQPDRILSLQRANNHGHGCRSCRRRQHKPTWPPGSPGPPFSPFIASWALPSARQCGSLYVGALDTRQ